MRPIPLLLILAGAVCAQDTPPAEGKPKPNREAMKASIEAAFTAGDANADGKLDRTEFTAAVAALRAAAPKGNERHPAPPEPTAEELSKIYTKADANTDATLDKAEFGEAAKALRGHRPPKDGKDGAPPAPPKDGAAPPPPPSTQDGNATPPPPPSEPPKE